MTTQHDRILTTHVGSLPRPQDVVDLLFAKDTGDTVDEDTFDRDDHVGDRGRGPPPGRRRASTSSTTAR